MTPTFTSTILTYIESKDLLRTIYKLRVQCWGETGHFKESDYLNGWHDVLDLSAIHFVIMVDNTIVASARVNILNSVFEIPIYRVFTGYGYDKESNIGYISRNVVHPDFRNNGFSKILDLLRINYLKKMGVKLCFADARQLRMYVLN